MKVFMLGWEYPPHISGGLGTACEGMTNALAKLGVKVDFVVPKLYGKEKASHMALIDSETQSVVGLDDLNEGDSANLEDDFLKRAIRRIEIPSGLLPYYTAEQYEEVLEQKHIDATTKLLPEELEALLAEAAARAGGAGGGHYGNNLYAEVERYTRNVLLVARKRKFNVVHAHDWMTFPAGIAVARAAKVPLVVHVHSLEYDRTGANVTPRIDMIERAGTNLSDRVIAVSYYTRSIINEQHRVSLNKIAVAHNGVNAKFVPNKYKQQTSDGKKIVLFMGRITYQKGPEYFIDAAAKVLEQYQDVRFVIAGSGDMLPMLMRKVNEMGIADHFVFPGFMRGAEVEKMYALADLYVMPSVSEPFGIAPLEAMSHDCPVIISKQSGVSEVLNNALKVDFWDIDKMAHLILGCLKYPEVREDIIGMAREEVKRVTWDKNAEKVLKAYVEAIASYKSGLRPNQGDLNQTGGGKAEDAEASKSGKADT